MPFEYPASVRRGLSERMRQGEAVLAVHAESGICLGTLYRWKHQALVDAGLAAGTPSTQAPDLQSAAK
ncbi:transposase, partial [Arthrobacter oryzae]